VERENHIVALKTTHWFERVKGDVKPEDKPDWLVMDPNGRMEWTQLLHDSTGNLQAVSARNQSFEEERFQYWLRDTSRPSN